MLCQSDTIVTLRVVGGVLDAMQQWWSAVVRSLGDPGISKALEGADHLFTALGIFVAGIWAAGWTYFNYIRGRTYRPRCELTVTARTFRTETGDYLIPRVSFQNRGNSRILINQRGTGIQIAWTLPETVSGVDALGWSDPDHTYTIFDHHKWLEPSETIIDEQYVIPLPSSYTAVKLEARLCAQVTRFPRANIEVNANAVVPRDSAC